MRKKKETSRPLLCRVLWLYYIQQMNQREIGDYLGLSRVKVVRLLKEGRELGLVDIQIKSDDLFLFDLERELADLAGLDKVWVVPSGGDPIEAVGAGAVYRFQLALMKHKRISLGSGRTYYAMSKYLPAMRNIVTEEIISIGAYDTEDFIYDSMTMGHMLTSKLKAKFYQIKIPAFSDSPEVLKALSKTKMMTEAVEKVRSVDIAFIAVGAVASSRYLYYTRVSDSERKRLLNDNLVAEVDGNFFTIAGERSGPLKSVGIVLPLPMKCPVVLTAGGAEKVLAISALVRSGCVNEVVTDEDTARALIGIFQKDAAPAKKPARAKSGEGVRKAKKK